MWMKLALVLACAACLFGGVYGQDGEPRIHLLTKVAICNVGEHKAIYCKGENLKEPLMWYSPNGDKIERRSASNSRVFVERIEEKYLTLLIIKPVWINDTGNWTCKSGELSENIYILVGEKVVLDKNTVPYIGEEGRTAKLDCVARGTPKPVVQWYKDNKLIEEEGGRKYHVRVYEDNYQLEIRSLNHRDSGEYVCKVTQEALSYYDNKRIHVVVQHKPLLINPEGEEHPRVRNDASEYAVQEVYAILNETKNITCHTISNPPPIFQWVRKMPNGYDVAIPPEDTISISEDKLSSTLMLRVYNKSFLGQYECSARNSKGKVSIIFDVSIGNKPEMPESVSVERSTVDSIVFNVTCASCNYTEDESRVDPPDNLKILGYSFDLAPKVEGYPEPDWDTSFSKDVIDHNGTLYVVDGLPNTTTFHVRVRSINAAGYSDWLYLEEQPSTTDLAVRFLASLILIITAVLFNILTR